jgi:hypothetical protein
MLVGECIWLQGDFNKNTFYYLIKHQQEDNRNKCVTLGSLTKWQFTSRNLEPHLNKMIQILASMII